MRFCCIALFDEVALFLVAHMAWLGCLRIAKFTNTTPQSWLNMQQTLDIWQLQQTNAKAYAQIERVAA